MTYLHRMIHDAAAQDKALGWRISAMRQKLRISQRESAKRAGLDVRTWRKVEAGLGCQTPTFIAIPVFPTVCSIRDRYFCALS